MLRIQEGLARPNVQPIDEYRTALPMIRMALAEFVVIPDTGPMIRDEAEAIALAIRELGERAR